MYKVAILGTGNVASQFIKVFSKSPQIEITQIYNHKPISLVDYIDFETITNTDQLKPADVYLICVKDDFVEDITNKIIYQNAIIAHTSGSLPLLQSKGRNAVFYPLQTFSKDKSVNFKNLPFCIETEYKPDFKILEKIVNHIEAKAYKVNTKQRQELHLAAVFVCNFVNHLYHIGHEICKQKDLPFEILKPLIQETADKIYYNNPRDTQTGPAKRNDKTTIERHLQQLQESDLKNIYRNLTTSIQKTYE